MSAKLNIPVIGAGSIGTRHHNNLLALGCASERVSFRSAGIEGVASLLQQHSVDGLVIATATPVREEIIRVCAAHNVPMYIEKPLAFTMQQLQGIYDCCSAELASRSMVGFMMRYHPLLHRALAHNLNDIYRFELEIGHDVTQWRQNWRFADSYAANPNGGGVLLDLCHELDLAKVLFPQVELSAVDSIGHKDYPEVDFATTISLAATCGLQGRVSMDYLAPVSTRKIRLYGINSIVEIDLGALSYCEYKADEASGKSETLSFDRNEMFMDAMRDFIALLAGDTGAASLSLKENLLPRLDTARENCELIASAWQQRQFTGQLSHQIT